jgi:nucleotide-binding universal stress UspA family protein
MNWEERIKLAGAPGPPIAESRSRTLLPQERVTESSLVGPALKSDSARAIVVGLGDSDRSADALVLAQLLAESLGAPLVLAHNQPREAVREFLESEDDQLMRSLSDAGFAQVQDLVRSHHEPGFRIARADSPADGLRQIAEQEDAQLVVIGPSEPSGLGRLRPRSVGERLLSEVRLPVAIAPRGYARAEHSLTLITSAFDGSPESRRALEWAAHLTTSAAGRLRVISVHAPIPVTGLGFAAQSVDVDLRQGLKREQAGAIAALGQPVEALVRDGSPAGVLVEASREADLLVMGSRGRGPLPAALLGSVAHFVVRRAACPLVVHPHGAGNPCHDR